jgi:hypothetical protein
VRGREQDMDFIFDEKPKELIFRDDKNEREIAFLYRDPSAEQRIKYGSAIGSLFRGKEINDIEIEDISKIQFDFGMMILTGFRTSGVPVNISSEPGSELFRGNWKELISNRMPDLIILLAVKVFETGGFVPEKN